VKRTLDESPDVEGRRDRLIRLCCSLPEAEAERAGATHLAFKVRKKIFAYYTFNHHGDGVIALWCKAAPGERDRLVQGSPNHYFVPPYVGPKGWVALRLDTTRVDWKAVKELAFVSYFLTAPAGLRKPAGQARPAGARSSRRRRTRESS
jgi:predicted DNA-binding protein (MmcQ/YjbR family)